MQVLPTHKIEAKQKQDTYPDLGGDRRGTSQREREPEIVGEKHQKANDHHHRSQDERSDSSQVVLNELSEVASLIADRTIAGYGFCHGRDREYIDHPHNQQDDHPGDWTHTSECNWQSEDGCTNRLGKGQGIGGPKRR